MLEEKEISRKDGIKAEDCAVIAQVASKFQSNIFIIKDNKKVNAKSIMGLLSLNMKYGERVYVSTEGDDEAEACMKICELL